MPPQVDPCRRSGDLARADDRLPAGVHRPEQGSPDPVRHEVHRDDRTDQVRLSRAQDPDRHRPRPEAHQKGPGRRGGPEHQSPGRRNNLWTALPGRQPGGVPGGKRRHARPAQKDEAGAVLRSYRPGRPVPARTDGKRYDRHLCRYQARPPPGRIPLRASECRTFRGRPSPRQVPAASSSPRSPSTSVPPSTCRRAGRTG